MTDAVSMTDLAERLRAADGDGVRRDIVDRLDALVARIAEATRIGVTSSEFGRLQKIDRAARAARAVVQAYR